MRETLQDISRSDDDQSLSKAGEPVQPAPKGASEILSDYSEIKFQMSEFARSMNRGPLNTLIADHPRDEGISPDEFNMGLVPLVHKPDHGRYVNDERFGGRVYLDGEYGFALACTPPTTSYPRLIAAVSFLGRDQLENYFDKLDPLKEIPEDMPDGIVIVQIQGPSREIMYNGISGLHESSLSVIRRFNYQQVLVESSIAFADQIGIKDIGILAASRNRNRTLPSSRAGFSASVDQLRPHYDLTAKRMGFTMQKDGIHRLKLG